MTVEATVLVDPARVRGEIDPRIYGFLFEHIGRVIYDGMFDPSSKHADEHGFRRDVLDAAAELKPTVLRWPGGNFASGYHWRDGIGPREQRPARHDLAWGVIEPNAFGTEEFLALCTRLGAEPYINLNASTGSFDEAQAWLEYCNSTHALPEALMRNAGSHPDPHNVALWGIGNENYGWWQHLHVDAAQYAEIAREWGKLLHWADERVEIIGVGGPSSEWNRTVLRDAGRSIDYLSLHFYWHGDPNDRYYPMVTGPASAEKFVVETWQTALDVGKELGLSSMPRLAVDEWGVWEKTYRPFIEADLETLMRTGLTARAGIDNRFEESYDLKDALTVAGWLHVMWRHPEKIRIANFAQLVNAIAPIMTQDAGVLRQTIFHPIALARKFAGNVALDVAVRIDHGVPASAEIGGSIAALDAGGTTDGRRLHISLVNRLVDEDLSVRVDGPAGRARLFTLHDDDPFASNTFASPDRVVPQGSEVDLSEPVVLPPHSHTTVVVGR